MPKSSQVYGLLLIQFCLRIAVLAHLLLLPVFAAAQEGSVATGVFDRQTVVVNTVTRPPFSMEENGTHAGFSMDLLRALAERLNWDLEIQRQDGFAAMLYGVPGGQADVAAANISITAVREETMDFSQPIFESGLSIMVSNEDRTQPSLLRALFSWDLAAAIGLAFLILFCGGMLMWVFERKAQPYFDRPLNEAWFPSFWWALNLVVNGGFEERVPRSAFGRVFAVLLVLSSLFVVSVFVAKITAVMTVDAITGSVQGVNDLYGKRVGTVEASTAAGFLDRREIDFIGYPGLDQLIAGFEAGEVRVVVFDAPILDHYIRDGGYATGHIVGNRFMTEYYGLAFVEGSPLVEPTNRALLAMQEDGSYEQLYRKWFGARR